MNDLEILKQYIADAVVWVPVWTALISLLSAWGGVWLNNYLQGKYRQKIDSRRERKWTYIAYFMVQWVSFIRHDVKRGTPLSYEEMCNQFKTADFSIAINAVKLVAPENICSLCDQLNNIVNGKEVVSREELIALIDQIGKSMTSDITSCN